MGSADNNVLDWPVQLFYKCISALYLLGMMKLKYRLCTLIRLVDTPPIYEFPIYIVIVFALTV